MPSAMTAPSMHPPDTEPAKRPSSSSTSWLPTAAAETTPRWRRRWRSRHRGPPRASARQPPADRDPVRPDVAEIRSSFFSGSRLASRHGHRWPKAWGSRDQCRIRASIESRQSTPAFPRQAEHVHRGADPGKEALQVPAFPGPRSSIRPVRARNTRPLPCNDHGIPDATTPFREDHRHPRPRDARRRPSRSLFAAGVDVFRLNFSHGDHDGHRRCLEAIRTIESATGRPIGILLDLQGPKLRIGRLAGGSAMLEEGGSFVFDLDSGTRRPGTGLASPSRSLRRAEAGDEPPRRRRQGQARSRNVRREFAGRG